MWYITLFTTLVCLSTYYATVADNFVAQSILLALGLFTATTTMIGVGLACVSKLYLIKPTGFFKKLVAYFHIGFLGSVSFFLFSYDLPLLAILFAVNVAYNLMRVLFGVKANSEEVVKALKEMGFKVKTIRK